jgi:hypothetical protein
MWLQKGYRDVFEKLVIAIQLLLLEALVASGLLVSSAPAQMGQGSDKTANKPMTGTPVRNLPSGLPKRAKMYYANLWGVDSLRVKAVESGELIRFSWRVVDPDRAAALNDKKAEPLLLDSQAGVKLVVPTMEKVGQLRQTGTPVVAKSYWMAFSNPGRKVKPGDFVSVVIGQFHAIGLVVE